MPYTTFDNNSRLGHKSVESTMAYLHIDLSRKRDIQKRFIEYAQSKITHDKKIDKLIDWENNKKTLTWLDSL